ncbi:hypothetical protein B1sIIB91_01085 [Candidatus Nanopelagicus abundans]|jgi:hypothetical protein|uniref:Uncharacterized protein n=1 Tax=Candidatus Nanopelagicus abundans TaxID=1884916 RepID=A0A249L3D9_9ACTN|nr:DUF5719 family protein [Candidatus Nanopelagicus abundans]ASY23527.1 hypothetical protein B1sIIB91_01085 [Candidatus Nanopelagicus abundans]
MKFKPLNFRVIALILTIFLLAAATYFAPEKSDQVKLTSTYPATVCPAIGNKVSSIAALTNSKVNRRLVDGRSKKLNPGKSSVIALTKEAVLVEGNAGTAITFANNAWKSVVPCSVSNGMQWFVGGSGALTSKSFLYIVNSGFSESVVDLEIFTPNGALEPRSVSIPQNSTKKLSVDSLIPGEDIIVIGVKTISGRVSSYLFDERKKGLKSLGADFIAPIGSSSKKVTISAISGLTRKLVSQANSASHSMRLLVPGKIDANISVTINSNDGNFVPIGLAELNVKSQRVLNIPLTFAPTNQAFSIIIDSDQPLLASVLSTFTYGKSSEIAWATAADDLAKWSVNLTGSRPTLTFSGKKINVAISATGINGKKITETVTGSNFAIWRPPVGLNRLQITANTKGISGGVIFLPEVGSIGSSYIPMNNGANLETASEPIADASVITRG